MNGVTTGFLYDGVQAIAELRGNAFEAVYHTGLVIDEVLARYGSSGNRTLLTDALMSVIAQANDDQSVANFYAYSAYGQAITLGPDDGNSIQYTGRENDGTGLYFYRARYYDPTLKQWLSEDPIGIAGGINLYTYVRGNPVSYKDPTGLQLSGGSRDVQRQQVANNQGEQGAAPGSVQSAVAQCIDNATVAGAIAGGCVGGAAGARAGGFFFFVGVLGGAYAGGFGGYLIGDLICPWIYSK